MSVFVAALISTVSARRRRRRPAHLPVSRQICLIYLVVVTIIIYRISNMSRGRGASRRHRHYWRVPRRHLSSATSSRPGGGGPEGQPRSGVRVQRSNLMHMRSSDSRPDDSTSTLGNDTPTILIFLTAKLFQWSIQNFARDKYHHPRPRSPVSISLCPYSLRL